MSVKIQYQSDLHLEFEHGDIRYQIPDISADIIVLAGDIGLTSPLYFDWVLEQTKGTPTILILGNHEPYRDVLQGSYGQWKKVMANTHVHVLDNSTVELSGIRFIGSTLWTDYKLFDNDPSEAQGMSHGMINDYRLIEFEEDNQRRRFSPEDAMCLHQESLSYIIAELNKPFSGSTLVVSHHAPSPQSLPVNDRSDKLRASYASDLSAIIQELQPEAWIHGHLHNSSDYRIGKTQVLCNPRGYSPLKLNPEFDPEASLIL